MQVDVTLTNRFAWITCEGNLKEELRKYWSYYAKGYFYNPRFKLRQRARAMAEADGLEVDENSLPGWDGRIQMFSRGRLPAGLFRATRAECEEKLGIEFSVCYQLPQVDPGQKITELSDAKWQYQDQCVESMVTAIKRGGGIVLAATRTGKTRTAARFFKRILNYHCLFIVDQVDLLYQNAEEIQKWLGEKVGIVGDKSYTVNRVTVATIQTLHKHANDLKFLEWFKKVKIVVVDELHDQLNRRNFDVLLKIAPLAQYGLTATLQLGKKDVRTRAFAFAGPVIFQFPMAKGIETGVLVEGRCIQLLFPSVSEPSMPYKAEYLEQVVENTLKIKTCKALVSSLVLAGRYVMVLVERVRHLDELSDELVDIDHYVLCGDVKQRSRVKSREQFESGDIKVLIANKVMKKGITLKRLDAVIEMAELKSPNDVVQKFGRGLGLHEDKSDLIYVDVGTQSGRLRTAAKSRKKALVAEGVEVEVCKVKTAMEAVNAVSRFLGGNDQMKLFGS
jgi:superfamily II DNA or RNA helicase